MLMAHPVEHTVAVLFGGRSSEHEISLRSAVYVLQNVPAPWRIIPVGIARTGQMFSLEGTYSAQDFQGVTPADLASFVGQEEHTFLGGGTRVPSVILPIPRPELESLPESELRILNLEAGVAFPVLHGPNGEDGRLQGLLELAELDYVGCDLRASAVGIDKELQKKLARDAGIAVAQFESIGEEEWRERQSEAVKRIEGAIGYPCFVKPNALGSAVGCGKAKNTTELKKLVHEALRFDDRVLVEELLQGTEVECAFLGSGDNPKITIAAEIAPKDFYSYEAKYLTEDGAQIYLPARLEPERMELLKAQARTLAKVFRLSGLCRIDFWKRTSDGAFLFNEINTLPGLTSISQFPKLWEYEGVKAEAWIEEVLNRAVALGKRRREKEVSSH
jgi:D-alanine-D-alanine ligase